MKAGQRAWTREELILAINLYCKLPFGKLDQRTPEVQELASLIDRTPGSVSFKLNNFASLDPSLKARGIKGASNASNLDKEIWKEFFNDWDALPFESEKLLAERKNQSVEESALISLEEIPKEGIERERIVKTRVNQKFFRNSILAAYDNTCCNTGINQPEFLIAGHIRPWSVDEKNRMNPQNGIAINALHDKAFEKGLLTITPDYRIRISSVLKNNKNDFVRSYFVQYDGKEMIMPKRFLPDAEFLKYHNEQRYQG